LWDARLLRLWIVEAAAVVTPAIRTDNSIAESLVKRGFVI
jgi:hypothetical protein